METVARRRNRRRARRFPARRGWKVSARTFSTCRSVFLPSVACFLTETLPRLLCLLAGISRWRFNNDSILDKRCCRWIQIYAWQWMIAIDVLDSFQTRFLIQVSFPPRVSRFSNVEAFFRSLVPRRFQPILVRRRWSEYRSNAFIPFKQFWCIKQLILFITFDLFVEAHVSFHLRFIIFSCGKPYEDFPLDPLRMILLGLLCWLTTNLPCTCFHLTTRFSSGEKAGVNYFVCSVEYKCSSFPLEDHLLCLRLDERKLIIGTGFNYRSELFCGYLVSMLYHLYLLLRWSRLGHCSLYLFSCRGFVIHPFLTIDVCAVELLYWQLWINCSLKCFSFFNCPCGRLTRKSHGRLWFFL